MFDKFRYAVLVLLLVFIAACGKLPVNEPGHSVDSFTTDFESGNTDGWNKNYNEQTTTFQIVSDITARSGSYCGKFTITPGDITTFANRSEIYRFNTANWGTETYYAWSFMIPADYQDCTAPDWEVIGQFHDLPDFVAGENYENFIPAHPPVALVHSEGNITLTINTPDNTPYNVQKIACAKGVWHDVVMRIYWSPDWDGYIEAWFDGSHLTPYNGTDYRFYRPNMNNKAGNYLKLGLYRSAEIKTTNTVYFDEIRVGNSYAEVAP